MPSTPSASIEWWRREPPVAVADGGLEPTAAAGAGPQPRFAYRALIALTIIMVAAPQEFVPALAPFRIALIAASLAAAAHLFNKLSRRAVARVRVPAVFIAGLLLCWAIVTIPASMWPGGSVQTLNELYLKSVIAFWLIGEIVDTPARLRRLFWTLSILVLPLAITALRQFGSGATPSGGRIGGYGGGLTGNPNDLALMLNIIAPLAGSLALSAKRPAWRLAASGLALLAAATVIVTFSRAGFVTMMLTGTLFLRLLIRRGTWRPVVLLAIAVVIVIPFLPTGYVERMQTVLSIESDPTGSSQERWRDTVAAVEFVRSHPIVGAGLGMDILALNEVRGKYWVHVHDAYLNYAIDLGLPGLFMFVALLVASLLSVRKAERRAAHVNPELALLASGARISLSGYALAAFFHPTAYHFYFYYLAGLAVAFDRLGASIPAAREAPAEGISSTANR
jgi:O-antigen ligase